MPQVSKSPNEPARLVSKPPLPPKRRAINRSLKQREREAPDVDWERSLEHFAAAVSDDLDELHARFIKKNEVTFSSWKQLWNDARMSAAFHVEFWDSSPTNTHKTILQQTLDALVHCIEVNDGAFESVAEVTSLIGRIFALYSAFSVQLGVPKHKIDVDPKAWSALLTIDFVMRSTAASLLPTAAREVKAIMHRLVVEEKTFLRCLQGFGPSVRVRYHVASGQAFQRASAGQDLLTGTDKAVERNAPVSFSTIEELKSLDAHYRETMGRAQSFTTVLSSSGAVLTGRRSNLTLSASKLPKLDLSDNIQNLTHALTTYAVYKANAKQRKNDRVARAAAAREKDERKLSQTKANSEGGDNNSNLNDCVTDQLSSRAESLAKAQDNPLRRRDSNSEAFFESELYADIVCEQVESGIDPATVNIRKSLQSSEISDEDSDPLADLEWELTQSINAVSPQGVRHNESDKSPPLARLNRSSAKTISRQKSVSTSVTCRTKAKQYSAISEARKEASDANFGRGDLKLVTSERKNSVPKNALTSLRREETQSLALTSNIIGKGAQTLASERMSAKDVKSPAVSSMRATKFSAGSAISISDSWATQSTADSDGLSTIQAELDAIPKLAKSFQAACDEYPTSLTAAKKNRKEKEMTCQSSPDVLRQNSEFNCTGSENAGQNRLMLPSGHSTQTFPAHSNVVTEQLKAKDDFSSSNQVAQRSRVSACERSMASDFKLRRSSRFTSLASDAESNALGELEKELDASILMEPVLPLSRLVRTKTTSRKRVSKSPPVRKSIRGNAKKQRLTTIKASHKSGTNQRTLLDKGQDSSQRNGMAGDSESDGLTELVAELDFNVPAQMHSVPTSTSFERSTAPSKIMLSPVLKPLPAQNSSSIRRSARLNSIASKSESEALEDLMLELSGTHAAHNLSVVSATKPHFQTRTTRNQITRTKGEKLRRGQNEDGPQKKRSRPTFPTKLKMNNVENEAMANPSSRQRVLSMDLRSSRRSDSVVFDTLSGDINNVTRVVLTRRDIKLQNDRFAGLDASLK
ncbi:Small nuclear RNA activating complex (SNAPc), subunit SNAP43 [Plasmopara halstedii]|uniref:Small nuclear RNA activating complex (SNAPc), subunit SNAP43 n=1 Tax=Plasmopara halstedii TaxID=4781 RepID=A0A0P1AQQ4_PLAHL|nr:Small nuclear RNA activating complex (SNAPc), subunit SNAP43 [Plasmopara halstedii]CEG43220.1 Small nuclear RNA activating complex (SNAPc), subunit SNAP43 [Plasmopara halstedii]|eukprot:XP_024579589.1 Small nuclear RNA activating complex (SNAPc), subunit SNAP43 [Plasmopara halstedii]